MALSTRTTCFALRGTRMKMGHVPAVAATAALLLGSSASAGALESPPLSDVIKRVEPKEYLVKVDLHVEAYQNRIEADDQYKMNLENTPVVFPLVPDGGYHELDLTRLDAKMYLDDNLAPPDFTEFKLIDVGSLETQLARFLIKEFKGKQVDIRMDEYVTCYDAKVDEDRAMKIGWPEQWDSDIQSALQPQQYIESTNETVVSALNKILQGNDPKRLTPWVLAKVLARGSIQNFQVSGTSISRDRHGKIDGLNVNGAEKAITTGRGPWFDQVCMYVALCRAAGLPTRAVIGLDNQKEGEVTAWAEFFLPTAGWISVDLRKLKASPGMMRQLDRHWEGFGTNDQLNELVPIAHHFHPPVGVFAAGLKGKPLLWGWFPVPEHTPSYQRLRLILSDAPKRGGRPSPGADPTRSKDR